MSALREIAAVFGISFDTAPLAKGNAAIDATKQRVTTLGTRISGALATVREHSSSLSSDIAKGVRPVLEAVGPFLAAAAAAAAFASSVTQQAHALTAAAATMRVTTQQLQEMQHAGVMAGLSLDESTAAFGTFATGARAAAYGGGEAAQALWRLGIRTRDASRQIRPASDVLDDVAARFDRVQNPARRARLATQLFGEAGVRLIPILHAGAGGLAEWRAEVAALGGGFSPAALASARQYEQSLERWRITSDALRSQLAAALLPTLGRFVDVVRHAGVWMHGLLAPTHGIRNALALLGAVGAAAAAALIVAWLPVAAPFLAIAAAVGIVYLIVDDLVTLFEGGHSVIGDFIDSLLGVGAAQGIVTMLRDGWREFVHDLAEGVQDIEDFVGRFTVLRDLAHDLREGLRDIVGTPDRAAVTAASIGAAPPTSAAEASAQQAEALRAQAIARVQAQLMAARGPAAPAAPVVHDNRSTHNEFHLHGSDPRALAHQIEQVLTRVQGNQHDADHPQTVQDG